MYLCLQNAKIIYNAMNIEHIINPEWSIIIKEIQVYEDLKILILDYSCSLQLC